MKTGSPSSSAVCCCYFPLALLSTESDDTALVTATTIKMIQNVLIGVVGSRSMLRRQSI